MKLSRLVVLILLLGDILVFFMMQSQFDENGRWALVGMALILAIIWVFLGDSPKQKRKVKRVRSIPNEVDEESEEESQICLLYTSPSPRDVNRSRMPSSA